MATMLVNPEIVYTPDILRSYQNVELRTDSNQKEASFKANANVLVSVCPTLCELLKEKIQDEITVLILSGFSESLMKNLEHFIHTGFLNVDNDQIEDLQNDFKFLGVPVNDKFWSNEAPDPTVKIEIKDNEESILDFSSPSSSLNQTKSNSQDVSKVNKKNKKVSRKKVPVKVKGAKRKKVFRIEELVVYNSDGRQDHFRCWKCDFKNHNANKLVKHVKNKHNKFLHHVTGPFQCELCSTSFRTIGMYCRHILNNCKPGGVCDVCGKSFETEWKIKQHKKLDHNGKPTPCDICGKVYSSELKMKAHRHVAHSESQCEYCSLLFPNKRKLERHILNVHTSDDQKPFKCNICEKTFVRQQTLKEHNDIHNNIKRYKCQFCDYRCTSSSNKNKHERNSHQYIRSASKDKQ